MNHLDLFSGIGGFSLAAKWAWGAAHNPVAFVEKDPFCRKVLAKHWPEVKQYDDICTFDAKPYRGTVDLLTGGFPCQDVSQFGVTHKGLQGERSGLWREMLRVVREVQPVWIVAENVAALKNNGLDAVCADLEGAGYTVTPLLLGAYAFGACHVRRRFFIVAHRHGFGVERRSKFALPQFKEFYRRQDGRRVAPLLHRTAIHESGVCLSGDGLPGVVARLDRHGKDSLKALGNAIVPQVAYEIMRGIMLAESADSIGDIR